MTAPSPVAATRFAAMMRIEHSARQAETPAALRFVIVNETRELVPYVQALLLAGREGEPLRAAAIADLPAVDRTAPLTAWVERRAAAVAAGTRAVEAHALDRAAAPAEELREWDDLSPARVLWLPLIAPGHGRVGVLWLARDEPWQPAEIALLGHLAETYAHAVRALTPRHLSGRVLAWLRGKRTRYLLVALFAAVLLLPVRLTALAPAEVVARDPAVITAPIDGVVRRVAVQPNEKVAPGDLLVQLEDTDLGNRLAVAERALAVASAELHRTRQNSFVDPRAKGLVAELAAQVDLRRAEAEFARYQLARTAVRADRAGIAVLDDPKDWEGRPVAVGERILLIADPARVELRAMLPVRDAVVLSPGAAVKLFLDTDPLAAVPAEVVRAAYRPEETAEAILAYRVTARFAEDTPPLRIGRRGIAKLHGPRVSLFYYLFRRPITAARQWLGW